jgi:hypothetical protein
LHPHRGADDDHEVEQDDERGVDERERHGARLPTPAPAQPSFRTPQPGRAAASLALASAVTRQALASGLIRASIARHGVQGVQPAAAGAPGGLPRTGGPPRPPAGVAGAGLVAAAVGLLAARWRPSRGR